MSRYIYISTMIKKIIIALFVVLLFSMPASAEFFTENNATSPYQYNVTISDSSGTNNASNVYLNGNAGTNFSSVYFTNANGSVTFPHCTLDNSTGKTWVNITQAGVFRLNYGNLSRSSSENCSSTFYQFQDNTTIDFLGALTVNYVNTAFEAQVRPTNAVHDLYFGLARATTSPWGNGAIFIQTVTASNLRYIITRNAATDATQNEAPSFTNDTDVNLLITLFGATYQAYVDGNAIGAGTALQLPATPMGLYFRQQAGTGRVHYAFARNFTSPEPTITTWGNASADEYIPIISSDTIRYSNDTEISYLDSSGFIKRQSIIVTENYSGSWKINFGLCSNSAIFAAHGQIYKNGVAYGTYRTNSIGSCITYTETFINISILSGDEISIYADIEVGDATGSTKQFRILFDYDYANFTPTLLTPANGSLLSFNFPPQTDDITFTWSSIGESGYQFQVAEDTAFNILEYDITTTTATTTQAIDAGTHYWRVRTNNVGLDDGNWSDTFSFLMTETTPSISGAAIQGVVYFLSGNTPIPLQSATVFLYNATFTEQKLTGSNGYFLFDSLENNSVYYLKASLKDYQTSEIITINVSGVMTYNIQLKPTEPTFFENDKQYVLFTARWLFCWSDCDIEGATMTVYKSGEATAAQIGAESNPKTTDSTGSASFLLFKTQQYRITLVNSTQGINSEMTLYPKDTSYLWLIDRADEPFQDNDVLERDAILTTVTKSVINSTAAYINVTYNDTLTQTTNITIYLNQTNSSLSSANGTGNMTASFIVSPYQGQSYLIHFFGYNSEYGTIDYTYSVLFEKTDVGISGIPSALWLWFAVGVMFFTAAIFTASTVELGLIIVCAEGWIFLALGLFGSLGTTGTTRFGVALSLISVLAIMAYAKKQQTKEGYT